MDERAALDVARTIRPHLDELVGDAAVEVDGELARLLRRSDKGELVGPDVQRVIDRRPATREWARHLLEVTFGDRDYQSVPGFILNLPPPRYACPRFPECGTEFYRYSLADHVEPCPVHHIELVLDAG